MKKELKSYYDSRLSFGKKAYTEEVGSRLNLYSYKTLVAYIKNGKAYVNGEYSATTMRHIKEFLKQNGFFVSTTKQVLKDYGVKNLDKGKYGRF